MMAFQFHCAIKNLYTWKRNRGYQGHVPTLKYSLILVVPPEQASDFANYYVEDSVRKSEIYARNVCRLEYKKTKQGKCKEMK